MYLKNLSWLAIEKVIKLASMFITSIIVSRSLGVTDFGQYNFVISITLLFSPLIMFGFDEYYFQKFITVKSKKYEEKLVNTCVTIRVMLSLLLLFISSIIFLLTKELIILLIIITSMHFTFSSFLIFQIYNNAKLKSAVNAKVNIITTISVSVIRLILFYYDTGLLSYLAVYSLELIISGFLFLKTYPNKIKFDFDFKFYIKIGKRVIPLIVSSLAVVVYYKVDQLMLGLMVDYHAVGIYAVQAQIVLAVNLILQILINGTFPAWFENGKIQDKYLIGTYKLSLLFSILIIVSSLLFSEMVISYIWGVEFSQASEILTLTLIGTLFSGVGFIASKQMIHMKLQYFRMKRIIGGMIINIFLNLMLIPNLGIHGAAIATVFSHVYSGFIGNALSKETRVVLVKQITAFRVYNLNEVICLFRRLRFG